MTQGQGFVFGAGTGALTNPILGLTPCSAPSWCRGCIEMHRKPARAASVLPVRSPASATAKLSQPRSLTCTDWVAPSLFLVFLEHSLIPQKSPFPFVLIIQQFMDYLIKFCGLLTRTTGGRLETHTTDYGYERGRWGQNSGREHNPGLGWARQADRPAMAVLCVARLPHDFMSSAPESGSVHCLYDLCVQHRTGK